MSINERINDKLTSVFLKPEQLFLDLQNPRLFGDKDYLGASSEFEPDDLWAQEITRQYVYKKHNVGPLIDSIKQVGFLKLDRIVAREFSEGQFVVIEGNRRLTAIKTILGEARRRLIELDSHVLSSLSEIEVLVLNSDKERGARDAWMIQGLRHITGVRDWGPYQQAKLVHTLVKEEGLTFKQAGQSIGINPSRASSMLRAFWGLRQMEEDESFGLRATAEYFSHFEQAYLKLPVREWLGWDEEQERYINEEPLQSFYQLITIGVEGVAQPKMKSQEIRDILPGVLTHPEARKLFVGGEASLREAHALTLASNGNRVEFSKSAAYLVEHLSSFSQAMSFGKNEVRLIKKLHMETAKILSKCGEL